MLRRFRRPALLLLPVVLLASLTACGDDNGGASTYDGLDAVTITGDVGKEPEVAWKGEMKTDKIETTTITKGDGAAIEDGAQVVTQIWIGNGFTQKKAFSTYDKDQPETLTNDDSISPIFVEAMKGATLGSRVAVTAPADKAFGEGGNPKLEIGNKDSVLVIVDLVEVYAPPKTVDVPQSRLPGLILENGEPVGLDFKGLPEPKTDGDLLRSIVKKGKGKTVTSKMTVTADYLGQVYKAKLPFDESYSKDPVPFGLTDVIPGWTSGLSGVKVGSRVLLQIPPDLGYGAAGNPDAGIKGTDTLYFVVDIISAK